MTLNLENLEALLKEDSKLRAECIPNECHAITLQIIDQVPALIARVRELEHHLRQVKTGVVLFKTIPPELVYQISKSLGDE